MHQPREERPPHRSHAAARQRGGRRGAVFAALASVVLVGACGGDSGESAPSTSGVEADVVEVVLDDHRFSPAVLAVGDARVVRALNLGGLEHSWTVLEEPVETELELGSATVLAETRVEVGQSATVDISAVAPGRYQVVCVIPGHLSAGMVGELVVDG